MQTESVGQGTGNNKLFGLLHPKVTAQIGHYCILWLFGRSSKIIILPYYVNGRLSSGSTLVIIERKTKDSKGSYEVEYRMGRFAEYRTYDSRMLAHGPAAV